jgi:hypothetical protein
MAVKQWGGQPAQKRWPRNVSKIKIAGDIAEGIIKAGDTAHRGIGAQRAPVIVGHLRYPNWSIAFHHPDRVVLGGGWSKPCLDCLRDRNQGRHWKTHSFAGRVSKV